ncbi:Bug family tripartite tricarboxylate transporter substrate binding protein [Roseomonas xinghualingensis]|uniref:Bug family tripartite tricarboxylate transporter substrate binding protein n=1 Tax=Roseomonas xinghualingensis TaxID=2986475 RepID=UPI0021F13031|nr:tripartite tricarboxylate transporter substrate binding protein [Roseomonas sp. SXEYE001]MCV4206966.1 tripartite tricarboxylate transporter substrate binding protein [Roseomonas sp. SXEYE001]
MISRRWMIAGTAVGLATSGQAFAQREWKPDRPIRFIVGFAAGGVSDTVVRLVAGEMSRHLGVPIVVDNRPGASGNLGTLAVLQAPADGYTVGFSGIHLTTNPALLPSLGYGPRADLQMVSQFTQLPIVVLASVKSGITSMAELITRAKADAVPISTAGIGTSSHLGPELLFRVAGGRFEPVQYRSGSEAFQALMAGDTQAMFDPSASYHSGAAAEGRVRILAVMQEHRATALPDVPAFGELGLPAAAQMRSWNGACVRRGTPEAAVQALHAAIVAAIASPAVQGPFRNLGIEPTLSESPAANQAFYLSELDRWTEILRKPS